jgi:hypothetical protein
MGFPPEIWITLLKAVPNRKTLLDAICSSKYVFNIFKENRQRILLNVFSEETKQKCISSDTEAENIIIRVVQDATAREDALTLGEGALQGLLYVQAWTGAKAVAYELVDMYTKADQHEKALDVQHRMWDEAINEGQWDAASSAAYFLVCQYKKFGRKINAERFSLPSTPSEGALQRVLNAKDWTGSKGITRNRMQDIARGLLAAQSEGYNNDV